MIYLNWKRDWFANNFVNSNRDWLYFPDKDEIHSFDPLMGLEIQDSSDYWKGYSRSVYSQSCKPMTVDQKLDKIISLLEGR